MLLFRTSIGPASLKHLLSRFNCFFEKEAFRRAVAAECIPARPRAHAWMQMDPSLIFSPLQRLKLKQGCGPHRIGFGNNQSNGIGRNPLNTFPAELTLSR